MNLWLLMLLLPLVSITRTSGSWNSEQIHLSLGRNSSSEFIVTWVTLNETNEIPSVLIYERGKSENVSISYGKSDKFVDPGDQSKIRFIHRVTLSNLKPSSEYFYKVIGQSNWYSFTTLSPNGKEEEKFLIFGDWGFDGEHLLTSLTNELELSKISASIALGDFAYDLHDDNGDVGDSFMNLIEPFAARVPFQTLPGNHEQFYNFSHYDARFTMIDEASEYYRFTQYGTSQIEAQYNWIEKDLKEASLPQNRAKRPWIIVLGHTPLYADNLENMKDARRIITSKFNPEKLFCQTGVDVVISGHIHKYQRTWPIYDGTVRNGSTNEPYTDADAPVHLISGSGGCWYGLSNPSDTLPLKSIAFSNYNYSYTVMSVFNETHLKFQQKLGDMSNITLDDFYVIKSNHKPYKNCN